MSSTNPASLNHPQGQGSGNQTGAPSPDATAKKLGPVPPPPYSEYHVPAVASNAVQHPSHSSSIPPTHPVHPKPQHSGMPFQHSSLNFAPGPNQPQGINVPVIVVQPSTPGIPPTPGPYHQFGPTPLNDRQVLLPYAFYTERAIVDSRARWRFLRSFLCAIGVYLGIALLVGVEGYGDGWWTFGVNGSWAAS